MLGQLFAAHTQLGRKTEDFVDLLKAAEIDVSVSSLFAWRALAVKGQPVASPVKAPGRKRAASAIVPIEEVADDLNAAVSKRAAKTAAVIVHHPASVASASGCGPLLKRPPPAQPNLRAKDKYYKRR